MTPRIYNRENLSNRSIRSHHNNQIPAKEKARQFKSITMCSTTTTYACGHSHMEKTSCKHKRTGFFCIPSSRSKVCLAVTRRNSPSICRPCRERQVREGRERQAARRNTAPEPAGSDSEVLDPELARQFAALPHFTLPARPAAVAMPPPTQPYQPPRMSSFRSNQRVQRSNAVGTRPQRGPTFHHPVPVSPARPAFLNSDRPLTSPFSRGRPRVSPNIPPSVTTTHVRDRSVSPVEPGFSDPRSVSPDEYGRAPEHYR